MHTQLLVSMSLLAWCSQAARDEADESGDALTKLGGLLKKYAASAHPSLEAEIAQAGGTTELAHKRASRAPRDPGLNLTVGQTVYLHHDGTGTTGTSSRVVSSGRDNQGHPIITNQSSRRIGGNEPPNIATESPSGRPKLKRSGSIPERFQNRSGQGDIDPEENNEELETQLWNPDAMCGDISAGTLAEQIREAEGITAWAAKNRTMARCPRKFLSWNGDKIIETRFKLKAVTKQNSLVKQKGITVDAARQIIMSQYPEKFNRGGTACAWVVDGGSSGGRLYQFTEQQFCPKADIVPLVCPSGADTNHIIAFAGTNTSDGKTLRFRDVIGVKAEVEPKDARDWLKGVEWVSSSSKRDEFVLCYAHSLAKKVGEKENSCSRSTLFIGVTAGFREYLENVSMAEDKDAQHAKIKNAISYFNLALKYQLLKYAPRTKNLGGLQILSIQREGAMEASATQAVAQASGNSIAQNAIGVFSMGGKSSQFTSFKGDRATLNLRVGHLAGMAIIKRGLEDGIADVVSMRERMADRKSVV